MFLLLLCVGTAHTLKPNLMVFLCPELYPAILNTLPVTGKRLHGWLEHERPKSATRSTLPREHPAVLKKPTGGRREGRKLPSLQVGSKAAPEEEHAVFLIVFLMMCESVRSGRETRDICQSRNAEEETAGAAVPGDPPQRRRERCFQLNIHAEQTV